MQLFTKLYQKTIMWSRHRHAPFYLTGASFAEASFFPVPPDVMLVTMGLAKPERVWDYAWLATIGSVCGGVLGYIIGAFFFRFVDPYIVQFGYEASFQTVQMWFNQWGFVVVFIAGFSPVPYKLFTIGAGVMSIAFLPFVFASLVGRGLRFFLVSAAMFWGGARIEGFIQKYIERIGWIVTFVIIGLCVLWKMSTLS